MLGTEGEFYWSDLGGGSAGSRPLALPATATYSNNWTGTLSTRLGVAFDTLLVYSKARVAWANNDYNLTFPALYSSTVSDTENRLARWWWCRMGATGRPRSKAPIWTLAKRAKASPRSAEHRSTRTDTQVSTIKFGVNYRFY